MSSAQVLNPHMSYEGNVKSRLESGRSGRTADTYQKLLNGQQHISYPVRLCRPGDHDPTMAGQVRKALPSLIPGFKGGVHSHRVDASQFSRVKCQIGESLSSSGTQISTEHPHGECTHGPMQIKGTADALLRKNSCESDSLSRVAHRPSSRTGGASAKQLMSWGHKNWVAKDSRATHGLQVSSPMNSEEGPSSREMGDRRIRSRAGVHDSQHTDALEAESAANVQQTRRGMMDRAGMHQTLEVRSAKHVISPRNQPVRSRSNRDGRDHVEASNSKRQTTPKKKRKDHEGVSSRHPKIVAGTASRGKVSGRSKDLNKKASKLSEWTGLTQNTMELLLKLREEEEVRQLRQRAVMRWLNHIPSPPKESIGSEGTMEQGGSSTCTSSDDSMDMDSLQETTPTHDGHSSRRLCRYVRHAQEKPGAMPLSPLSQAYVKYHGDHRAAAQGLQGGSLQLVKKPEFEFVDEDSFNGAWSKKPPGLKYDSGMQDSDGYIDSDEEHPSAEQLAASDSAFIARHVRELDAIPEMVSGSDVVDDTNHRGCSAHKPAGVEIFTSGTDSGCDVPIRPARIADGKWTMEMSSIEKWVEGKEQAKAFKKGYARRDSEPELEIAADVHVMEPNAYGSAQKRALEDGLGWCLIDGDCDSSRIAVGFHSGDGTKSPCSASQTLKMSARSSTFSDEQGQRFHVKYSIPEGQAVANKWANEEEVSEYLNSTTDLQSGEGTPLCDTVSEIPLPSPRPGTEYRPSGSIVDGFSVDDEVFGRPTLGERVPEVRKFVQESGSPAPQATYWLPEFCREVPIETGSALPSSRSEPARWHDNPLSPHYPDGDDNVDMFAARPMQWEQRSPQLVSNITQHASQLESRNVYEQKMTTRQKIWRYVKQAKPSYTKTRGENNSSNNKKSSGQPRRCKGGLFSLVTQMCSSRGHHM